MTGVEVSRQERFYGNPVWHNEKINVSSKARFTNIRYIGVKNSTGLILRVYNTKALAALTRGGGVENNKKMPPDESTDVLFIDTFHC